MPDDPAPMMQTFSMPLLPGCDHLVIYFVRLGGDVKAEVSVPTRTWENLDPGRRERVLNAALAEFGRAGYSGGSLNVIAREAGVAKGSLFQYFADKFDFYAHVAEQTSLRVYEAMLPSLIAPAP